MTKKEATAYSQQTFESINTSMKMESNFGSQRNIADIVEVRNEKDRICEQTNVCVSRRNVGR